MIIQQGWVDCINFLLDIRSDREVVSGDIEFEVLKRKIGRTWLWALSQWECYSMRNLPASPFIMA